MNVEEFVRSLSDCSSQENEFNQFREVCPTHDLPDAPKIRCENLKKFLKAQLLNKPKYLWVAEAPGYNGSKRSGIFLVSEKNFEEVANKIGSEKFNVATKTEPKIATSVKVMWNLMKELPEFPLTFNVLPFHPFKEGNLMSNRTPKRDEIQRNLHYLKTLIDWFKPTEVIAIGRKAELALQELNTPYKYVRHPAQGGQSEFIEGIKRIYGLN